VGSAVREDSEAVLVGVLVGGVGAFVATIVAEGDVLTFFGSSLLHAENSIVTDMRDIINKR